VRLLRKREDLIDDLGCGHKLRKLAYVIADALHRETTVLVTSGGVASGQCLAVAAAATRHGIRAHLVYTGDHQARPPHPQGNYLLANLLGPTVTWHERSPWGERDAQVVAAAELESGRGEVPYVVRPGISDWPGLAGSIELGLELAAQLGPDNMPTYVVAPAGSGGTCLGMSMAAGLLGRRWSVVGVCIAGTRISIEHEGRALSEQAARALDRPDIVRAQVLYHDGALGAGYDQPLRAELEVMQDVLIRHGIVLDPTYMVKAFIGLTQLIAGREIPTGARVVLVNTGGVLPVFGDAPPLRAWYRDKLSERIAAPRRREGA
jgi:1-aminocyclopropane-1-carboxylate deaminase/D-cysteine desulfhydrase-like pyridoxal-dependent ACC family enzyme